MSNTDQLFRRVVLFGSLLILGIAVIGSLVGLAISGLIGLVSALIGAAMAAVFVTLTALSVWFGAKLSLAGFFGVVLGGWLVKLIAFLVLVVLLKGAAFIVGGILFFTLVAAVLGSLAVDAWVFTKTRLPLISEK